MKTKFLIPRAELIAITFGIATTPAFSQQQTAPIQIAEAELTELIAAIRPLGDSEVRGTVHFQKVQGGVRVTARLSGLEQGQEHAFHVHEFGDLSADDGTSAGGHFNPHGHPHGLPDQAERHVGDFGNLQADGEGNATHSLTVTNVKLSGDASILGRAVIVHAGADDGSQPSGNAGDRIGGGVIGIARGGLAEGPLTAGPDGRKQEQGEAPGTTIPDATRPAARPPREPEAKQPDETEPVPHSEANPGPRPDSSGGAIGGVAIPPPALRPEE